MYPPVLFRFSQRYLDSFSPETCSLLQTTVMMDRLTSAAGVLQVPLEFLAIEMIANLGVICRDSGY